MACWRDVSWARGVWPKPDGGRCGETESGARPEIVLYLLRLPWGRDYKNAYPDYSVPKLRHQHAAYIIAALDEYKSGQRPHPTMHAQASSLSDQDIKDIAAYLQGPEPVKPSRRRGIGAQASGALRACHGENGLA